MAESFEELGGVVKELVIDNIKCLVETYGVEVNPTVENVGLKYNEKLEIINKEDNESISQATLLPRNFLYKKEKDELLSLPARRIREKYHLLVREVDVSNESLVSYKSKKYSVPKRFIGSKMKKHDF